jgi:hypothetical protein
MSRMLDAIRGLGPADGRELREKLSAQAAAIGPREMRALRETQSSESTEPLAAWVHEDVTGRHE